MKLRNMRFRLILLYILVLIFFAKGTQGLPINDQVSEAKVKAALVLNFAQNIQWKNEEKIPAYRIGIVDQDSSVYHELKKIQDSHKVKGKPFRVEFLNLQKNELQCNVLYLGEKAGKMLSNIYHKINGKNILLITDRSEDRVLTMINITYNTDKNTFSFEVNKDNLDANEFTVNPKLLLLGGNFINVKELYVETYEQLRKESQQIEEYKVELEKISHEKEEYQVYIDELNQKIQTLGLSIKKSEEEYRNLSEKLQEKDNTLSERTHELRKKNEESLSLQGLIKNQLNAIQNATGKLDSLDNEITLKQNQLAEKQHLIDQQNDEINNKESIIALQQKRLIVTILLLLGAILSFIFAAWAYRIKQRLNLRLEKLVDERTRKLKISENHYMNLFENSPIAMLELDLSTLKESIKKTGYIEENLDFNELKKRIFENLKLVRILNLNQAGIDLFGFKDKQDAQKNHLKTYNDQSLDTIKSFYTGCIDRKPIYSYEGIRQTVNGEPLYLHFNWMVLPDYEENFKKVLLSINNITDLKKYQDELNRHKNHLEEIVLERTDEVIKLNNDLTLANAELQQKTEELTQIIQMLKETQNQLIQSEKMASIGMLTAGIAHEIINPVNYISGSYQALQTLIEDLWSLLNAFRSEVAVNLPEEILTNIETKHNLNSKDIYYSLRFLLSNIETGITRTTEIVRSLMTFSHNENHEYREFDIRLGVKDILVILKNKYYGRINVDEEYDPNLPLVSCNPTGINQVLMNLIANAVDAIDNQGTIAITAKYIAKRDEVTVSVRDSGHGIPEEILDKIFDPFFTTKEVGKGTGLGLYISYNIVKSHNGSIDVSSKVGIGTTVTVQIPRTQVSEKLPVG